MLHKDRPSQFTCSALYCHGPLLSTYASGSTSLSLMVLIRVLDALLKQCLTDILLGVRGIGCDEGIEDCTGDRGRG
jgi:hypothetical protein